MYATVYFLNLTDRQVQKLNGHAGWDTDIGQRYLKAKAGAVDEHLDMFKPAAVIDSKEAEDVWTRLQNLTMNGWANDPTIHCAIDRPRSMDVGDFILWADGRRQRVDDAGFTDF